MSEEIKKYKQGNKKLGEDSLYSSEDNRKKLMAEAERLKSEFETNIKENNTIRPIQPTTIVFDSESEFNEFINYAASTKKDESEGLERIRQLMKNHKPAKYLNENKINLSDSNLKWLEARTIILAPTGSYAYGTNTEESDKDYKGVCIPPVDYYLGLEAFNEYNNSGGKNFKNTKDDVDVNIIHINKFVKDAMEGVPNNIEILFLRKEDYLKVTPLGQILIDNRHLFLSKQIQRKFGGYAFSQIQKLKTKQSNGTGRQDLIEKYGYDAKFLMHSIRLLTSAIEILETGDFCTYRPNRQLLLDCRNGKYSLEEALEMVEIYDNQLKTALEKSHLPKTPDYQKINKLLIEINRHGLELS